MVALLTTRQPTVERIDVDGEAGYFLRDPVRKLPLGYKPEKFPFGHGWGFGSQRTSYELRRLPEEGIEVLYPIWPNHEGIGNGQRHGYEERLMLKMIELAAKENNGPVNVGGVSKGGFVAATVTAKYRPEEVQALQIYCTPDHIGESARKVTRRVIGEAPGYLPHYIGRNIQKLWSHDETLNGSDSSILELIRDYLNDFNGGRIDFAKEVLKFYRQRPISSYGTFPVPVLVVWGDQDPLLDSESQERLYQMSSDPRSRKEEIPGGEHGLIQHLNDVVIPLSLEFAEQFRHRRSMVPFYRSLAA